MAQWLMNLTQVRSLASLSGLRIWCSHALRCRSQTRLGSGIAVAAVSAGAVAPIRPPAWEPPCATGAALKRHIHTKKKNKRKSEGLHTKMT